MDAVSVKLDGDLTKQRGVKVIHVGGEMRRPKKKPVSLSFDDGQIARVDARAAQSGMNRSGQIQRDLTAYWTLLHDGMLRVRGVLTADEARYLAQIFKGRVLVASDDVLWCDSMLSAYVRKSANYGDRAMAAAVASKIDKSDHFARLAMMDWIRRVSVCADESLFDGFLKKDGPLEIV